ncbi:hypothetical protein [Variovorax sp. LG9.2]|jgi:hypothetical protein|uniref:hypothetical protein n=1 Tax=Variovorax sp. LG9.2 TaxID=3048626 RepID=UPI002B233F4C|nr:hypothetical protein [Variovorax sp. LG9.2]MEB0055388.1 hypothetical protein [Variovorax sp. LG9.2]
MSFSIVRWSSTALMVSVTLVTPFWLAGCTVAPRQPAAEASVSPPAHAAVPPSPPAVQPVEVEPTPPATQPASIFTLITQGPVAAMLQYSEKVRGMSGGELSTELQRVGDPGDSPTTQMQVALVLAQTRVPADLARAMGLLQRVSTSNASDAKPLQPLARALASRYNEQRRVEDDRDRQVAQLRDAQRRIDQLNDRIEALRAIERSFARPAANAPTGSGTPAGGAAPAANSGNGAKPAP